MMASVADEQHDLPMSGAMPVEINARWGDSMTLRAVVLGAVAVIAAFAGGLQVGRAQTSSQPPDPTETIELENAQVRVLRVRISPHSKSQMHAHPNRVVVPLSVQRSRATTSDGAVDERSRTPGQVFWASANTHMTENLSDQPLETLMVEIKAPAPATP
jgi:beta-alanine degradation protein BauB